LVQDEWKNIKSIKSKYVFGHLELPHFKMNGMVEMPDYGTIQVDHFNSIEYVFSGHFHKRQIKDNIYYIGNPFPHNFSDAWDDDRGMMILEWDGTPKFINYKNGPKYRTIALSQLLSDPLLYVDHNTFAKITIDIRLTFDELNFIKDVLMGGLKLKEATLIQEKLDEYQNDNSEVQFQTVDQIVKDSIDTLDSSTYDKEILLQIYRTLESE
jgi:DNA repair exonuclease SbcCD nuclease subunit